MGYHASRSLIGSAVVIALVVAPLGCGKNVFKAGGKKDPAEDATLALEKNDCNSAIDILQSALVGDPTNPQYLSILSTAYALRADIDPLIIGSKFANAGTSLALDGTTNSITALFAFVPDATSDVLSDIDEAVTILSTQIPAASRQPGDVFKSAIYMTASLVLHVKALDTLNTGTLTTAEIANLSDASANAILNNLNAAAILLGGNTTGTGSGSASQQAAAALTKYSAQIAAAPGTTNADKLRAYLAAHPGAGAAKPSP